MNFQLRVWRQEGPNEPGRFETYLAENIRPDMSFLEMLDQVNENLAVEGRQTIAYEYDCREGICGTCSLEINGVPHGPQKATTTCQTYMRSFRDGDEIYIEPFRARAFPIIRDLVVDRSSFDRIMRAGGYVSVKTGNAPDANTLPIPKQAAEEALDSAACIGCGACVAACPNASASLFVAAKVSHLASLPQGDVERKERARKMVGAMDAEMFGSCTNHGECEAVCPMEISTKHISKMNREYLRASLTSN
jgi:succinate dehydrogenase / fumarate reductase iron-sulfur subunit